MIGVPDLLTHVLLAYVGATALSWRAAWFDRALVPVAMVGGVLPDVAKAYLLVPDGTVAALIGLPFTWNGLHRLGGAVALAGLGCLLVHRRSRRRVFGVLLAGALLHLGLDGLITRANGLAPPYLYPLTWWQPPAGGLYLSSDPWPAAASVVLALAVVVYDRRRAPG